MNHRRIGRDIYAVHARSGIHSTQVADRGQILIAGTTDQLDPAPLTKRFIASETGMPWQRNDQAPSS